MTTSNNSSVTSIQPEAVTRVFCYGSRELPDPSAKLSPAEVKTFYSAIHADLVNASVEGGHFEGNRQVYTFTRAIGTKG